MVVNLFWIKMAKKGLFLSFDVTHATHVTFLIDWLERPEAATRASLPEQLVAKDHVAYLSD
jgi:hypothetical protein